MGQPKHEKISSELRAAIVAGKYREGDRLPTEAELVQRYHTSRPTIARALRELTHEGLISRRAGSGTFVKKPAETHGQLFGVLLARSGETEIFEPICRSITKTLQARKHGLLWASAAADDSGDMAEQMWQACQQCIQRKVAGVFLAPVELVPNFAAVNERLARALDAAHIPVVLIDRDLYKHPQRSHYDRVGIDNRRAGFIVTSHLLEHGCKRIGFFCRQHSAETVATRVEGYRDALQHRGIPATAELIAEGDPDDQAFVQDFLDRARPDGIVCANDITAARLLRTFEVLGVRTPDDIRTVGMDDVRYASLLRVPLTSLHQPCEQIGRSAVRAMLDRVANPKQPPRDILFQCELVVRKSCGAHLASA